MGFLSGSMTCLRFRASGAAPKSFDPAHLNALERHAAGRQRIASADGTECGWAAGGHVLDTAFDLGKNAVADALCFDLRIDTDRLPADLFKAYYAAEVKALSANNPSGFPSAKQKREAREAARGRLEDEAGDGRFRKRKCVPVLWDGRSNEVLFGATALTHVGRFAALFQQTFARDLEAVTAGRRYAEVLEEMSKVQKPADMYPGTLLSKFVPNVTPDDAVWIADTGGRDFLGNEFLLWLWYTSEGEADTVKVAVADGSEVTFMIARRLLLDCPRGQTGLDGFRHEGPSRLPEAKRAAQAGKLPRLAGLTLVRHDAQYELTLHAETLAVGAARLPKPEDESAQARREARVDAVRELLATCDLLYGAFLAQRLGKGWSGTLAKMQRWLGADERRVA